MTASAIFLVGSIATSAAQNMATLIAGRTVQGLGGGGIVVLVNITVSDIVTMRERGKYLAAVGATWALASAFGPILGGVFASNASWRWCFIINIPIGIIAMIIIFYFLRLHSPKIGVKEGLKQVDWWGTFFAVGGTTLFLTGLDFGGVTDPWDSPLVLCCLIIGALMLVTLIFVEWKFAANPIMPPRVFGNRTNAASYLVCFLHAQVFIAGAFYIPLYFQSALGKSALMSGVLTLPFVFMLSVGSVMTGIIIAKTGNYRPVMRIGLVFTVAGVGAFVDWDRNSNYAKIVFYQFIAGFGLGPMFQSPLIAIHSTIEPRDIGVATAAFAFIRNLAGAVGGKSPLFEELRKKFTTRPSDPTAPETAELSQTIQCLMSVVSQLDRHCTLLVGDVIYTNWAGRSQNFYKTYMAFILQLISAHPQHTPKVVQMLVKHLTCETVKDAQRTGTAFNSRRDIFATVHQMLDTILGLAPTVWNSLFTAISAAFPFKGQKKIHQITYIQNLLKVLKYAPAAKTKILGLVFEKMIQLDVEIQINLDDLDEGEGEELDRQLKISLDSKSGQNPSDSGIGEDEEEEEDDDSDSDDEDEDDAENGEPRTIEMIQETVDKLDAMLSIVFSYYAARFPKASIKEPAQEDVETFELLLHFFDSIILTTFKSQYVQFIIFWAAQKSPVFMDIFLGMLVERAMDNTKPQVARQAAAAYIASFVARAKSLDRDAVRSVVQMLCLWLEKYLRDREIECTSPDVRKFGGFYAVFQAVMYVFCFRWRDLKGKNSVTSDEEESPIELQRGPQSWAPGLQVIERLITSKFNPLKVCSPTVVNQFADVANHFGLAYCFSIMERNKRGQLFSNSGTISSAGRLEATQLETYFPFDPFKLIITKAWVDPLYSQWEPVPGMKTDDGEGGEGDEGDIDEGEEAEEGEDEEDEESSAESGDDDDMGDSEDEGSDDE
ncbi:hypothetical protein ABW20_dc0102025 [Dactylellina cionopaga]|nr:hypothetical protein ABW20_dc0102025 [Dactylellina cionopaga]